jgi:hypothetical protein
MGRHVETAGYFCKARVAGDPDLFEGRQRKVAARRRGDPRHFDLLLCMFPPVSHIIQRDEVSADDAIISIGP